MNLYLKYLLNALSFLLSVYVYFGITFGLIDLIDLDDYSPFINILRSLVVYIYIPIVPFFLLFSFRESRLLYITKLKKNILKVLKLISTFVFLSAVINFLSAIDSADGYQEVEIFIFFHLSLWILYTAVFTFIYLKYLKLSVITKSGSISSNFRLLFFKTLFYITTSIAIFGTINITSCSDHPGFLGLFSLLGFFISILISIIDLIISLYKNYFSFLILIYPLFFGCSCYCFYQLEEALRNDGKCNLILGPDDSGMAITFILIALYSFITSKTKPSISK